MFRKALIQFGTIVLVILLSGCGARDIPNLDKQVQDSWNQMERVYEYRSDLIPKLADLINDLAHMSHPALDEVLAARTGVVNTQINFRGVMLDNPKIMEKYRASQKKLGETLEQLAVVVKFEEKLNAEPRFHTLWTKLEQNKKDISAQKQNFAQAVAAYNRELETFSGSFWKSILYRDYQVREL